VCISNIIIFVEGDKNEKLKMRGRPAAARVARSKQRSQARCILFPSHPPAAALTAAGC
jgi:hypothetical protein